VKRANDNDERVVTVSLRELKDLLRELVREAREDAVSLEVAKRLANIEALQRLLLERRHASVRVGIKRSISMRERLRNEAEQHPDQPNERHLRIAREMQARAAKR
jgi:hypothetical protein